MILHNEYGKNLCDKTENCLNRKYFSGPLQFFFTSLNKHDSVKNGIMEAVYNRNFYWSCRNEYRTNLHLITETVYNGFMP